MDDNDLPAKPERVDLPETDEAEPGPAPSLARRLLMAREARGWVVAAAAIMVAVAAVAPGLDYSDLTGAAALTRVTATAQDVTCDAEDQTGGVGGQSLSCGFVCPSGPGTVSVSVDADDSDAHVSGTADCSGDAAHCSGKNSCSDTAARTASGTGSCSADSDEAVDSGLYVQCSASADSIPGPHEDLGSEICPVTDPTPVCIQPVCYQLQTPGVEQSDVLVDLCNAVWEQVASSITPTSSVTAFVVQTSQGIAQGAGLVCQGFVCRPVIPQCSVDLKENASMIVREVRSCTVGPLPSQ